jgi:hypothetical protein
VGTGGQEAPGKGVDMCEQQANRAEPIMQACTARRSAAAPERAPVCRHRDRYHNHTLPLPRPPALCRAHLRNLCGLAGARLPHNDDDLVLLNCLQQVVPAGGGGMAEGQRRDGKGEGRG